ncbi:MAG: FHA domain-containing protein [Deltaproteobacteria bacterium]|nr:FHA domain-containing protein [Deltaproteobacteria bacterium]
MRVRVQNPEVADFAFSVGPKAVIVGRSGAGVDIEIPWDTSLSRRHGRFWLEEGSVHFEDLGSRNGCWIEGRRISEGRLIVGDKLRLGETLFTVEEGSPEGSIATTAERSVPEDVQRIIDAFKTKDRATIPPPAPVTRIELPIEPRSAAPKAEPAGAPRFIDAGSLCSPRFSDAGSLRSPRFIGSTQVKLELTKEELEKVWSAELSKSRLFVATQTPPKLGTSIVIFLDCPAGELALRSEVVQILDAERARAAGLQPGVGLHVVDLHASKKAQIAEYLAGRTDRF